MPDNRGNSGPNTEPWVTPRERLRVAIALDYLNARGSTILYDHGETIVDSILAHVTEVMAALVDAGQVSANHPPDDVWWLE